MNDKINKFIKSDICGKLFNDLYGNGRAAHIVQKKRYIRLVDEYLQSFGNNDYSIFSAPGRIEIIGNHTDHNAGKVIAAAVNLDVSPAAEDQGERSGWDCLNDILFL